MALVEELEADAEPGEPGEVEEEAEAPAVREKDADGWEDLMEGKVRKRTIKEGEGEEPEVQRDVLCNYEVRRSAEGEILQRRKLARYRIGESEAVPGLELVLRHMRVGEEAEVSCISRFAWGPVGCRAAEPGESDVPPDTDVYFRVKLLDLFPQPAEGPDWTQRVQELEWRKKNGNDHFKRKNMQQACKCYEKGMQIFEETPIQAPASLGLSGQAAAAQVTKTLADVASNLSAVYLELGRARDALDHAKMAVDMVPKHEKALFRVAKAAFLLGDFDQCQERLDVLPEDPAVKRLAADLERARNKHASKSKKLGAALLEAAGEGREYVEKPPPEELPTFFQEIVQSVTPTKKQVILLCVLAVISLSAMFLAPRRYLPQAVMMSLLCSTLVFAVYTALTMEEEDKDDAKKTK